MALFISRFNKKLKNMVAMAMYEDKRRIQNNQNNLEKCENKLGKFLYSSLSCLVDIRKVPPPG